MNTNIHYRWTTPSRSVLRALVSFAVGSFFGFIVGHPPIVPHSCPSPHYTAHFLERSTSFNQAQPLLVSLRGAAPDQIITEEQPTPQLLVPSTSSTISSAASASSTSFNPHAVSSSSPLPISSSTSSEQSSSVLPTSSSSEEQSESSVQTPFPAFDHTVFPVARTPNWGAMKTPAEWNRDYGEMTRDEFVRIPPYDLALLQTPMKDLLKNRDDPANIRIITAKLLYSTRFFGTYDLDAGEFSGDHAGIDLKLPKGTPVGAIAGGMVSDVIRESTGLGLHVVIEHRLEGKTYYSIYGHLSTVIVTKGDTVLPGEMIGRVGSTGRSTGNHLHLQIDRGESGENPHTVYWPRRTPTRVEAERHTIHPLVFIAEHTR